MKKEKYYIIVYLNTSRISKETTYIESIKKAGWSKDYILCDTVPNINDAHRFAHKETALNHIKNLEKQNKDLKLSIKEISVTRKFYVEDYKVKSIILSSTQIKTSTGKIFTTREDAYNYLEASSRKEKRDILKELNGYTQEQLINDNEILSTKYNNLKRYLELKHLIGNLETAIPKILPNSIDFILEG